jgi:predicted pyridoxine 5'-phosphate oxidase superfamily flavin-nucleotide-binding protein
MNEVFHEGEYHVQELMGVRKSSDTLSSMIKDSLPAVAKNFLAYLKFCVISLSTKNDELFSSVVYDIKSFITIEDDNTIYINLKNCSYIPKSYYENKEFKIGFLGIDFENAMRMRINGTATIINNSLKISTNEVYSNCPKFIKKRVHSENLKPTLAKSILKTKELKEELIKVITNTDTFFLSSLHKKRGADISHRGGKKGFVKIISSTQLQFDDMPGNNLYNTLGNIHTNSLVNMLFIDFEKNDTYVVIGNAKFNKTIIADKNVLRVTIECSEIIKDTNSFLLDYRNV